MTLASAGAISWPAQPARGRGSLPPCPRLPARGSGGQLRRRCEPRAPGGGAVFDAIALDVGNPSGLSVYWGGAVDADADAGSMLDQAGKSLRIA